MHKIVDSLNEENGKFNLFEDVESVEQTELNLTIFEARSFTMVMLASINTMFVKDIEKTKIIVLLSMDKLLKNMQIVTLLNEIRNMDDYTFEHSIDVCVLSLCAAILMGYCDDRLYDLGAGALLHDVGKIRISKDILNKPGSLNSSEYNEIKLHTKYGFEIISEQTNLQKRSAYIANYHHERMNGIGYPLGLTSYQISEDIRIVSIADVYDALASDRIYRNKMFPGEVINYIISNEANFYDEEIFNVFTKFVAVYPRGTKVELSNKFKGIVIQDNFKIPSRPLIKLIYDDNMPIDNTKIDNTKIDNTKIDNTKIDNTKIDKTKIDNTKIDNAKSKTAQNNTTENINAEIEIAGSETAKFETSKLEISELEISELEISELDLAIHTDVYISNIL